jgi:Uma2 family endonuclease
MSAAPQLYRVSVEEYLASELASPVKHEYVGGVVYAIAGRRNAHNLIASNALVALGASLRGSSCRAYNSDIKIRVHMPGQVRFYYPDASVICRPNPPTDSFHDEPAVVIEVLSRKTRRIDEGEKRDAYLTIPSLSAYLLIEQEAAAVAVYRRTEQGFVQETYTGLDATIPLKEIGAEAPLAELYDGIEFLPEPEDDADLS